MADAIVEVYRGAGVESVHHVSVAVCIGSGESTAYAGNQDVLTFARSAIKPWQALPLIEDGVADAFALTDEELALCCASHSGEARHTTAAASILRKISADEHTLACGPHPPFHAESARVLRERGERPGRLHNNCSGKHAGMLALAAHHDWPLAGYHLADHPVQLRMASEVARWTGIPEGDQVTAVDGCGVVTFAAPLRALAGGMARFAAAAGRSGSAEGQVVSAMTRHPEYVGGTGRLCTALMKVCGGRVFAKVGAEGVYLAGSPDAAAGIALKVEDGATRASEPMLIAVLRALDLLSDAEVDQLRTFAEPVITNTRDEEVGHIRASLRFGGRDG